jgi:hypothetical protein
MKLINKQTGLLLTALVMLTACENEVLDHPYYMGDSADLIFTDAEKIAAASVGLYDALQNSEFLGGRAQIYVDARGMDVNPPTFFGSLSMFNPTSSDATVTNAWQAAYRTINECNTFLKGIETAKTGKIISEDQYKIYSGEAKFIRSLVYFYALNFWGQSYVKDSQNLGIPLVRIAFDANNAFTDEAKIGRSTIDSCYIQIIADLQEAETKLPAKREDVYGGRATATSGAAQALLSRVYLYKNDNANAIAYANKVIGKYKLNGSVYNNFAVPGTSPEIIFFVAHNAADNPNTNNALGQHYGNNYRADITVTDAYVGLFSDKDARKTETLVNAKSAWWCNKYRKGSQDWAPVIRYAEVLLNKAEALVKSTNTIDVDAIALLNEVRQRSEPAKTYLASDFTDADALLQEILTERRRELAFEGHGSFDLFRNGKGIPAGRGSSLAPAIAYPDNYFALPIPNDDIEKNSYLVQNKGY